MSTTRANDVDSRREQKNQPTDTRARSQPFLRSAREGNKPERQNVSLLFVSAASFEHLRAREQNKKARSQNFARASSAVAGKKAIALIWFALRAQEETCRKPDCHEQADHRDAGKEDFL